MTRKPRQPQPHNWTSGPDPVTHAQWRAYTVAKCQAAYRGETWQLSRAAWCRAWQDHWHLRGRGRESWYLVRRDWNQPWSDHNIQVIDRQAFIYRQQLIKLERGIIRQIGMLPP